MSLSQTSPYGLTTLRSFRDIQMSLQTDPEKIIGMIENRRYENECVCANGCGRGTANLHMRAGEGVQFSECVGRVAEKLSYVLGLKAESRHSAATRKVPSNAA